MYVPEQLRDRNSTSDKHIATVTAASASCIQSCVHMSAMITRGQGESTHTLVFTVKTQKLAIFYF
jgi:hypothetical protein